MVMLLRSRPGDELQELVLYVLSAVVIGYFITRWLRGLHDRAQKHDHVVETDRDVAIPDHCVRCGRPHPKVRLQATRYYLGPGGRLVLPEMRRKYMFWYCRECAAPIQRRRNFGKAMIGVGFLFFLHMALLFLFAALSDDGTLYNLGKLYPRAGIFFGVTSLLVDVIAGGTLIDGGMIVMKHSPAVKIIDDGGDKVFFQFTNQVFRNHFAELNGAD